MQYFVDKIIKPYINESQYYSICEIGASLGRNTDKLLQLNNGLLTIIDPCLDTDLQAKYQNYNNVRVERGTSLTILDNISDVFDSFLIDGDHNWYTVYNELKIIEERGLLHEGGTIFLHDVCWPYGRRDMYYQPETIPAEFIHPYEKKGIIQGQSELSNFSGINADLYNAMYEGGARNGVITAIEDFLKIYKDKYHFFYIKEEWGLGILLKGKTKPSKFTFTKYFLYEVLRISRNVQHLI